MWKYAYCLLSEIQIQKIYSWSLCRLFYFWIGSVQMLTIFKGKCRFSWKVSHTHLFKNGSASFATKMGHLPLFHEAKSKVWDITPTPSIIFHKCNLYLSIYMYSSLKCIQNTIYNFCVKNFLIYKTIATCLN